MRDVRARERDFNNGYSRIDMSHQGIRRLRKVASRTSVAKSPLCSLMVPLPDG